MFKLFPVIICLILISCSTQKDIIRDKKIEIAVPAIKEKLEEVKSINVDSKIIDAINEFASDSTYYEAEKKIERGFIKVKMFLKKTSIFKQDTVSGPEIELEVTQNPVDTTLQDTTNIVTQRTPLTEYLVYFIAIIVLIGIIVVIIKFKK